MDKKTENRIAKQTAFLKSFGIEATLLVANKFDGEIVYYTNVGNNKKTYTFYGAVKKPYVDIMSESKFEQVKEEKLKKLETMVKRDIENLEQCKKERDALQIGDIICRTGGWEQTNVEYYKIVDMNKTKKTLKLRAVKSIYLDDGETIHAMSGHVIPDVNEFYNDEILTKKLSETNNVKFDNGTFSSGFIAKYTLDENGNKQYRPQYYSTYA